MDTPLSLLISFNVRMIIKVLEKSFISIYIYFYLFFVCLLKKSTHSCAEQVFLFPGPGPNLSLTARFQNL